MAAKYRMLLCDRLQTNSVLWACDRPDATPEAHHTKAVIEDELPKIPIILADNVFSYVIHNPEVENYPGAVPPFKRFFWEAWIDDEARLLDPECGQESGMDAETGEAYPGWWVSPLKDLRAYGYFVETWDKKKETLPFPDPDVPRFVDPDSPKSRWVIRVTEFLYWQDGTVEQTHEFETSVLGDGFPTDALSARQLFGPALEVGTERDREASKERDKSWYRMKALLFSFSLMNCKNTVIELAPPPPDALSRHHEKRYGRPLLRHSVMKIDHRLFRSPTLQDDDGKRKFGLSYHIVRGHFVRYVENPLFGEHYGTFWVPQHFRGSKKQGRTTQEHRVE